MGVVVAVVAAVVVVVERGGEVVPERGRSDVRVESAMVFGEREGGWYGGAVC